MFAVSHPVGFLWYVLAFEYRLYFQPTVSHSIGQWSGYDYQGFGLSRYAVCVVTPKKLYFLVARPISLTSSLEVAVVRQLSRANWDDVILTLPYRQSINLPACGSRAVSAVSPLCLVAGRTHHVDVSRQVGR